LASLAWIRCRRPNQPRNGAYKRIPDPHR
jgi:hypothetical protein